MYRTTAEQKDVSDALIKPSLIDYKHKAQEFEAPMVVGDTLSDEKENLDPSDQMSGVMKHFNFQKMDGCTINFNFSGSKKQLLNSFLHHTFVHLSFIYSFILL